MAKTLKQIIEGKKTNDHPPAGSDAKVAIRNHRRAGWTVVDGDIPTAKNKGTLVLVNSVGNKERHIEHQNGKVKYVKDRQLRYYDSPDDEEEYQRLTAQHADVKRKKMRLN